MSARRCDFLLKEKILPKFRHLIHIRLCIMKKNLQILETIQRRKCDDGDKIKAVRG